MMFSKLLKKETEYIDFWGEYQQTLNDLEYFEIIKRANKKLSAIAV